MRRTWILRVVVAAVAVALLAPASIAGAGEDEEKGKTFVGTVEGTDAYIAIVVGKTGAFGYICDGEAITHWLHGTVKKGTVTLSASTGAIVTAELDNGTLTGTALVPADPSVTDPEEVLAAATPHDFEATRAKGDAGLFRLEQDVEGTTFAAGWVVLEDGSLRGEVTVARVAGDETTTTTAPPATTTTAPVPVTPTQAAPTTTAPPATTAPPGTTSPANPGGVQADVGTAVVGQIAPPDVSALLPATPPPDLRPTKNVNPPSPECRAATKRLSVAISLFISAFDSGASQERLEQLAARGAALLKAMQIACGLV